MTPSPQISLVKSATDTDCQTITAADAVASIRDGKYADAIAQIRANPDQAETLKLKLPGILWSGQFKRRAIAGIEARSGLIVADMDALPDPAQTRDSLAFDDHAFCVFLSPTATGVKAVFRCPSEGDHADAYAAMEHHMRERYGITVDPSGKDVCRICFISHDPDLHYNPDAKPLPPAPAPEPATPTQPPKPPKPAPPASDISPGDDFDERGAWMVPELLRSAGWTQVGNSEKWRRPGVTNHHGATLGVAGPSVLKVFTSSVPNLPPGNYGPFRILAALSFGGDHSAAGRELARQGYGTRRPLSSAPKSGGATQDKLPGAEPGGTPESNEDRIRRMLRECAFDMGKPPPPLRPIFKLGDTIICTPGNLTTILAQAKVGKSAFVQAGMAAAMTLSETTADTLGIKGRNEDGKAFIYIDTEQAPYDFWHGIDRARKRALLQDVPAWVYAHGIAGFTTTDARRAVEIRMHDAYMDCEGIQAVIIDGVADLVNDVNDAEECSQLVAELHRLAIHYDCPIICVIHRNEGEKADSTARGHLGKQFIRKAQTNLLMEKEDEITLVWSNRQRGAPIFKKDAIRFRWDDDLKMHVSANAEVAATAADAKRQEWVELAESALRPGEKKTWAELVTALQEARRTPDKIPAERTIARWINTMKKIGILTVSYGYYSLKTSAA
ncbi:BT4734/BF3469 family protein [Geminisphaera colitermitum]|uniref:BT4734/BF3469 family protein n=1 Tax=Geminisphaera colitermitum TaxID=1148786 RepID=UPI00030E811B|nr:BT4734/BF3469 family protein [Geminisphaera colitermitum]